MMLKTITISAMLLLSSQAMSASLESAKVETTKITDSIKVDLNGELTQGSLITGLAVPSSVVLLNGKKVAVTEDGHFVIGFGRDAALNNTLVIKSKNGKSVTKELLLTKREYKIQRIEGISKKIMNPNMDNVHRSQEDNRDISAARKIKSDHLYFLESFIWPAKGPITGVYGSQRYFNGVPKRPHFGLDIAGPKGSDVIAPADGVVTLSKDMFYSGNTLLLDHGYGVSSTFLHLDTITVKVGQVIKQGEKLGTIGSSGRVTGPHLDWRINWFLERLDPYLLVKNVKQ